MAVRNSQQGINTSGTTTASVAVPTGNVAGDITIVGLQVDVASIAFTPPAGFQILDSFSGSTPDGNGVVLYWKRNTGTDSGAYNFTFTSNQWGIFSVALSGRHTTATPEACPSFHDFAANVSPVTLPTIGVNAIAGDDLLWVGSPDEVTGGGGVSFATPTGYAAQQSVIGGFIAISLFSQENVSAGFTGNVQGSYTTTNTAGRCAWLIRVPASAAADPTSDTPSLWLNTA